MRRMLQQRVGQLERRHRMVAGRRWLNSYEALPPNASILKNLARFN